MALFSKYGTLVDPEFFSVGFGSECVGNSDKATYDYAALNFEGLKAAPGDAVESSYFLSNILGPVPTPALFTNVNYLSNIIIAHTDLSKET